MQKNSVEASALEMKRDYYLKKLITEDGILEISIYGFLLNADGLDL